MGHVIDGVLCSEQQKQTKRATKLSNKKQITGVRICVTAVISDVHVVCIVCVL